MRITNYSRAKNAEQIKALFREIYPEWDESMLEMMAYDEKRVEHLRTKIAFENEKIIGQANVFWINKEKRVANLGYHVNPKYQKRGVGYQLAKRLIEDLNNEVKYFIVITTDDNIASQMLCKKLGFIKPTDEIDELVTNTKKYKKIQNPYFRVLYTDKV